MRIIHYIHAIELAQGGVVRAVLDVSSLTAASGHDVVIMTRNPADAPQDMRAGAPGRPRVHPIENHARGRRLSSHTLTQVRALLESADVVHLHTPWEIANLRIARTARELRKPYVLTLHGMLDDWSMAQKRTKKRLYLALAGRRLLEHAACLHCTAEFEMIQARKWTPNTRFQVIPLIFDLTDYLHPAPPELAAEHFRVDRSRPTVLFLSRLHPKKRPDILIEAIAILRNQGIPAQLLLAGTGDDDYVASLKRLARSRNLDDARFLGLVTGPLKTSLYSLADALAIPTSQENFGFVFPESLACETPVITTKGVDIWPELESSGGAIILDPPTPAAFARALADLLSDPLRRARMGQAGRRWVLDYLDNRRILSRFEEMYRNASHRN